MAKTTSPKKPAPKPAVKKAAAKKPTLAAAKKPAEKPSKPAASKPLQAVRNTLISSAAVKSAPPVKKAAVAPAAKKAPKSPAVKAVVKKAEMTRKLMDAPIPRHSPSPALAPDGNVAVHAIPLPDILKRQSNRPFD
jgi:hypothetical protein